MRRLGSWVRSIAGLLALILAVAGLTPSASAAENKSATASSLRASASATVAAKPLPSGALAQTTAAPAPADSGKGFFGTTAGRIALVVMAAGTSYMVYSAFKDNDPVHSVFRD